LAGVGGLAGAAAVGGLRLPDDCKTDQQLLTELQGEGSWHSKLQFQRFVGVGLHSRVVGLVAHGMGGASVVWQCSCSVLL
jgi:hypothetical protein